jgi:putative flippase GtrA
MLNPLFIYKFIKFGLVGFSGLIIDFGATYLLKEKFKANRYLANSIGFCLAASSNFMLNRIWTFQSTDPKIVQQYALFIAISLVGLAINNFIILLLNERLRVLKFYFAKLAATITVMLWNFLMNFFFTFG